MKTHKKAGLYVSPPPPPHVNLEMDEDRDATHDQMALRLRMNSPLLRLPTLNDGDDERYQISYRQDNDSESRIAGGSRCETLNGSSSPNFQPRLRLTPCLAMKKRNAQNNALRTSHQSARNTSFKPINFESETDKE